MSVNEGENLTRFGRTKPFHGFIWKGCVILIFLCIIGSAAGYSLFSTRYSLWNLIEIVLTSHPDSVTASSILSVTLEDDEAMVMEKLGPPLRTSSFTRSCHFYSERVILPIYTVVVVCYGHDGKVRSVRVTTSGGYLVYWLSENDLRLRLDDLQQIFGE